ALLHAVVDHAAPSATTPYLSEETAAVTGAAYVNLVRQIQASTWFDQDVAARLTAFDQQFGTGDPTIWQRPADLKPLLVPHGREVYASATSLWDSVAGRTGEGGQPLRAPAQFHDLLDIKRT